MGRNLGPLNIKDSYEGLVQISGSQLTDGSGSLIPSLDVTASFATTATSASHAIIADSALTATSASHALVADSALTATSSSHAVSSDTSISASHAVQADNALTATSASHAIFADTAGAATDVNALYTASVSDATISFLKGGGGTFPITINNVDNAVSSSYAVTASYAENAGGGGKFNDGAGLESIVGQMESSGSNASPQGFLFGSGSSITTTGKSATILGSYNSTLGGLGFGSAIIGGTDVTISSNYGGGVMTCQTVTNNGYFNLLAGSIRSTISGGNHNFIIGGDTNSASGNHSGIIGGQNNNASNNNSIVLGGASNTVSGLRAGILACESSIASGQMAVTIGGYGHNVSGPEAGAYSGDRNTISARGATLGGNNHTINSNANYTAIIAGGNHTINSSVTQSVIIGGSNITATASDTVYVPNLNISGSLTDSDGNIGTAGQALTSNGTDKVQWATVGGGGAAFPYTGSAEITGSLGVTGSISQEGSNSIVAGATPRVVILASSGSSLTTTQPDNMAIIASKACSINSTNTNTLAGGIFGAQSSTFGTGDLRASVILGGVNNTMNAKFSTITACENSSVSNYSNFLGGGFSQQINGDKSAIIGGINGRVNGGTNNTVAGGVGNNVNGSQNSLIAGSYNTIPSGVNDSAIIAGYNSDANHDRSVVIGGNALATTKADEVVVPKLTIAATATDVLTISNYASLNFADDTAAAAGGVPLGGVYHNAGAVRIRIA